ncbi:MAG: histidine kinase [Pseudomonadota bacterium]
MSRSVSESRKAPDPAPGRWFPNFCRTDVVFSLVVLGELVVLIMWLAPGRDGLSLRDLAVSSLFGQWLVLLCAVALCSLRPLLNRLPVLKGSVVAYLCILLLVAGGTAVAVSAERFAGFQLTSTDTSLARYVTNSVILAALVAAAALRYYYIQQQWRAGVEASSEAQVRALQARIRPHFLFNSMNTIASLIRTRPKVAEEAVLNLSDLFRAALSRSEESASLAAELTLCRRYMEIEQLRLGDRLAVNWDIDTLPGRETLPPLLLQPLFENAIYHGIQPRTEGGTVEVTGGRDGQRWWITLRNPMIAGARKPGNQIALNNIRQRLTHHFGEGATLAVQETVDQFQVTVSVPLGVAL